MSVVSSEVLNADTFRFVGDYLDGGPTLYTEVSELTHDDGTKTEKVVQMIRFENHEGRHPSTAAIYMDGEYFTPERLEACANRLRTLRSSPPVEVEPQVCPPRDQ